MVLSIVDIFHVFGLELPATAGLPPQEEPIKLPSLVLFAAKAQAYDLDSTSHTD